MKTATDENIRYSLSLGSTHITFIAARHGQTEKKSDFDNFFPAKNSPQQVQILGAARVSNQDAIKKGLVANIEALSMSILEARDEVEQQIGINIKNVLVCIAGSSAQFDNHIETIQVKNDEIRLPDIKKLFNNTLEYQAPEGYEYIHILPGLCSIDGKKVVSNPIGMWGKSLSISFHRIAFPQSDLYNIMKACNLASLIVDGFVYEPLAASQSTVTEEEKELGCVSISFGSYLTHVTVYLNNTPVFTKDYPIGSHHITRDLSIGLRTTQTEAERIKKEFGCASSAGTNHKFDKELIEIHSLEGNIIRSVTKQEMTKIIEARVKEILEAVSLDLKKSTLHTKVSKGVILSGGGSLLSGMAIATERILGLPARIGMPLNISGSIEGLKSPVWTAPIGSLSPFFTSYSQRKNLAEPFHFYKSSSLASKLWQKLTDPFASR